jgi:hypothetical protein
MRERHATRRRVLIACGSAITGSLIARSSPLLAQTTAPATQPGERKKKVDKGPPIEASLVRQFVGAAHADLSRTKEMLAENPKLVNATWDWGGGDFETALGGASHMGRPDIATFLLEHGARMDLFAAAMLGKLAIVKAAVEAFPDIVNVPGPHGIPLLRHAEAGKADEVIAYLRSLA